MPTKTFPYSDYYGREPIATEDQNTCDHPQLRPARHPGALKTCRTCDMAVLDFDVVYKLDDEGYFQFDHFYGDHEGEDE